MPGVVEDIGLLKPTIFPGVPRVFDRIYTGVMAKVRRMLAGRAMPAPVLPCTSRAAEQRVCLMVVSSCAMQLPPSYHRPNC